MNEVEISVVNRNDDQVSPKRPIGTEVFTATPLQQVDEIGEIEEIGTSLVLADLPWADRYDARNPPEALDERSRK